MILQTLWESYIWMFSEACINFFWKFSECSKSPFFWGGGYLNIRETLRERLICKHYGKITLEYSMNHLKLVSINIF